MHTELKREIGFTVLTLLVVVLLGINGERFFTRVDLTENRIYTISDVSKNIFDELEEGMSITYYVSDRLSRVSSLPDTIEDILREYAAYGKGDVSVRVADPEKEGVEEEIEELGIETRQIEVVEEREQTYADVYSGILVRYRGRKEVIPFAMRIETLEYELTSAIRDIIENKEKRVGILSGHPDRSVDNMYNMLRQSLSERYTVETLESGQPIPEGLDVLIAAGTELSIDDAIYIDRYIARGGKALFAAGGADIDVQESFEAEEIEEDNPILGLLSEYGVDVQSRLLLDAFSKRFRIPHSTPSGTSWEALDRYPHWVNVRSGGVSEDHPITAGFGGLDLLWPSPLRYKESPKADIETLISSSTKSWLMEPPFFIDPGKSSSFYPDEYYSQPEGDFGDGPYTAAVTIEGEVDHPYAEPADGVNSRMVIVGDSIFLTDFISFSGSLYNIDFVGNCVDWLALEEDMMDIRTRNVRPMRLDALPPERAEMQYSFAQFINLVFIPLLVLGFGLIRRYRRRRRGL
ncbi:MAG: GldG family protein [Spirochaetaceae bacterium]